MIELPELKIPVRDGKYARGQESIERILRTTLHLFIDEGYRALSLRRIANACDMKVGNLTYYFPTKDELVQTMVLAAVESYLDAFDSIMADPVLTDEQRLEAMIRLILEDIQSKKTTRLFPELWALANFEPFFAQCVNDVYISARRDINILIARMNPSLPVAERETLSLFISASMEGTTIFAGYDKPWTHRMPWLENIAVKTFVDLAKTAKAEDIHGLMPDVKNA